MNTTVVADKHLLSKLTSKQLGEELSDYAFANKIGVARSLWQLTRTGRRSIGITLLKAIIQTYPELIPDVIEYLRNSHEPT